ncbi:MAG: hypothetical protein CSA13_02405 [Clostridiales bacterium]|nr:MAG: hypothetical protein CSA13_02405 [Clostridiales bacterium]
MAKKIYQANYPNDNRGWIGTETFHIVLNSTAADNQIKLPDDSSFLFGEFYQVIDFGTNNVDTTKVTDMRAMFYRATNFNGDISDWNTAKVTDMRAMFSDATSFNGDISGWNTANVTDMGYMFYNATGYNQPIELDISGLKDDQYTTGKEGLANAFNGCPAPSIILNAGLRVQ